MFKFTAAKFQRRILCDVTRKQAGGLLMEDKNPAAGLKFNDLSLISKVLLG